MSVPPDLDMRVFCQQLEARKAELVLLSEAAKGAREPVELDQQSVGRLSRQDALQHQAMAIAQDLRRRAEMGKIDRALARICAGEFGWCGECGDAIVLKRLEIDPTVVWCAACADGFSR